MELVFRLVTVADVVTDSFSGGVMQRLGLGYDRLEDIKPDIIAASLSPMGPPGGQRTVAGE